MGYLKNDLIVVDAILTKKGRELIAKGDSSFNITQFAVSDDEIDYSLYNFNHPMGSSYYGEAIENMALIEAFPDENQVMKYKLITAAQGVYKLPYITIGTDSLILAAGASRTITPQTLNMNNTDAGGIVEPSGYSFQISNRSIFKTYEAVGGRRTSPLVSPGVVLSAAVSKTVTGTGLTLVPHIMGFSSNTTIKKATLTITGLDSGARLVIPITIKDRI
jgi:hypothetical protein